MGCEEEVLVQERKQSCLNNRDERYMGYDLERSMLAEGGWWMMTVRLRRVWL